MNENTLISPKLLLKMTESLPTVVIARARRTSMPPATSPVL